MAIRSNSKLHELSGSKLTFIEDTLAQHHGLIVDYAHMQTAIISQKTNLKTRRTTCIAELKAMREKMVKICAHIMSKGQN
ncbi:hypothetical protein AMTR_s00046p00193250 [Amborella trichopoda]|uniref:Uncharacterized protein n=1 Tax=Amborella trichopoda TaxID=13333 RepID=U5CXK5_AMBTC|nr:hypothetical protein AMTR_s00046p00193250 [Amborella trichopoda]